MATRYYFLRDYHDPPTGNFYRAGIAAPISSQAIIDRVMAVSPPIAFTADGLIDPDNVGPLAGITTLNGRAAGPIIATPALRATVGGSANARTLTTGAALSSIHTGFAVRFRAPSANTGAATINVDGTGAVACRTITGVALPSGYIRTDADTVAIYDGTFWVLDREIERGSNANGRYVRYADGTQECWTEPVSIDVTIAATAPIHRGVTSVSLPMSFVSTSDMAAFAWLSDDTVRTWAMCFPNTASVVTLRTFADTAQADRSVKVKVEGRWYS